MSDSEDTKNKLLLVLAVLLLLILISKVFPGADSSPSIIILLQEFLYAYRNFFLFFMTLCLAVSAGLIVIFGLEMAKVRKDMTALRYTDKISVEEYERKKQLETKVSLMNLKQSPMYRKYIQDKANGKFNEIILSENDEDDYLDSDLTSSTFH